MPVQIDVNMPESCDKCPFSRYTAAVDENYIYFCRILNLPVTINIEVCKRYKDCPLKECK